MRYGVLADIHGNLAALDAALAALHRAGVDRLLCLGDVVGYGPFPNECVRRVEEVGAVWVAGNHDLIAAGRMDDRRCGALARETMAWTRKVLDPDVRAHLEQLPLVAVPDAAIVLTHGALGDPGRYVAGAADADEQLRRLGDEHESAALLLLAHTHVSMAYGERAGMVLRRGSGRVALTAGERFVLNPGSVGQSRQVTARARVLVLDTAARGATFRSVRYDTAATARALRERGLPPEASHIPPSVRRALVARVRRTLRAAHPIS
jgi:predicted phosphodiesterase